MASLKPANGIITQAFGTRSGVGANVADITDSSTGTGAAEGTIAAGVGVSTILLPVVLDTVIAGDVLTAFLPGYKFKILAVDAYATVIVQTASDAASFNLEIGSTNVTGGVVACTSENLGTLGVKVAGTAVTALNTGSASDTISVEGSSVTDFAEGEIVLAIKIQNMDTADAFAVLAAQSAGITGSLETAGLMETS